MPAIHKPCRRRRLDPEERERLILEGAIKFFAEHGFEGQMRGLARELGISQGLVYRYFPNKDALIDRVYQVVFLNRWNTEWDSLLRDRARPLRDRLVRLYKSYAHTVDKYEVIRISLYSALKDEKIGTAYLQRISDNFIRPIIEETRASLDLPGPEERPISILEEQLVYSLHATLIYALTRKHVYCFDISDEIDFLIEIYVDNFLSGAERAFARIFSYEDEALRRPASSVAVGAVSG